MEPLNFASGGGDSASLAGGAPDTNITAGWVLNIIFLAAAIGLAAIVRLKYLPKPITNLQHTQIPHMSYVRLGLFGTFLSTVLVLIALFVDSWNDAFQFKTNSVVHHQLLQKCSESAECSLVQFSGVMTLITCVMAIVLGLVGLGLMSRHIADASKSKMSALSATTSPIGWIIRSWYVLLAQMYLMGYAALSWLVGGGAGGMNHISSSSWYILVVGFAAVGVSILALRQSFVNTSKVAVSKQPAPIDAIICLAVDPNDMKPETGGATTMIGDGHTTRDGETRRDSENEVGGTGEEGDFVGVTPGNHAPSTDEHRFGVTPANPTTAGGEDDVQQMSSIVQSRVNEPSGTHTRESSIDGSLNGDEPPLRTLEPRYPLSQWTRKTRLPALNHTPRGGLPRLGIRIGQPVAPVRSDAFLRPDLAHSRSLSTPPSQPVPPMRLHYQRPPLIGAIASPAQSPGITPRVTPRATPSQSPSMAPAGTTEDDGTVLHGTGEWNDLDFNNKELVQQ